MAEKSESVHAVSGYTGVTPKRDKWHAYITYKGVYYSLGSYRDIEDAVKARGRAKELVIADAQGLLNFYTELEKSFPQTPSRGSEPKREFPSTEWVSNATPMSAAKRSDNSSGYVGVYERRGKWEARICYKGHRFTLGRFESLQDAADSRSKAEEELKEDPENFVKLYSEKYRCFHV